MSLYSSSVPQMTKMLQNLRSWIDKATEHAKAKGFDPNVLVVARLVPDQYAFARQVQSACDSAKFAASRLSGRAAPVHPDTEQTIDELRARIGSCLEFLATIDEASFAGAEDRLVVLPYIPGKGMRGANYLTEMALPNFYFHVTTAYAILRHNGVPVGKMDFISGLTLENV